MNFTPKLKLLDHNVRPEHRSGWRYAVNSLAPLFVPRWSSHWILSSKRVSCGKLKSIPPRGTLPYRVPWIGFLHNPVNIPEWHEYQQCPRKCSSASQSGKQASQPVEEIVTLSRTLASWGE